MECSNLTAYQQSVVSFSMQVQKNSEGISLNSNLLPGPKRQLDIILLLINFRLHPYTLVGDISRMFYCINLDENIETITDFYGMMIQMQNLKYIGLKDLQWDRLTLHSWLSIPFIII